MNVTIETMWDAVRGYLLHQITCAYKWHEMDIDHEVILKGGSGYINWKTRYVRLENVNNH